MITLISTIKALLLASHIAAGEPCLCPGQVEGLDDEEYDCQVIAVIPALDLVMIGEASK